MKTEFMKIGAMFLLLSFFCIACSDAGPTKPRILISTDIRGAGHLGEDFINYYKGVVKMGDTPSLLYMMNGDPENPLGVIEISNLSPTTK